MSYKTLIGLEIHVELSTNTKMFCSCKNEFGAAPNTHVCPICLGHPGALPRINKQAIQDAIKAGLAFDCQIRDHIKMDRKKYFYPDLVKGFQISQDPLPLCYEGKVILSDEQGDKTIRIQRIHIEEDTGKSIHTEDGKTLMDYNRSGVPLIEIVTYPDIQTPEDGVAFLERLKERLKYIGVSDVKMEEGSLRCDVNINVVDEEGGRKTKISEIKNLNSFKAAQRAMEYEEKRHRDMLDHQETGRKETRRWDEAKQETVLMRYKEEGNDYRYSVEGDIPYIPVPADMVASIRKGLPELPHNKAQRFQKTYGIGAYDADILSQNQHLSAFYEDMVTRVGDAKFVANWILSDVLRRIKEKEMEPEDMTLDREHFATLLNLTKENKINQNTAKKLLREMFETDLDPMVVVQERGLIQIQDDSMLTAIVEEVLAENPSSIEDIKNGKDRALGFLVGQAMKKSKGKGNPQRFNEMIRERIHE